MMVGMALLLALGAHPSEAQDIPTKRTWSLGSEIDVIPYATGGFYGSGFWGRDGWKFRSIVARTNIPSFLVSEGYKDKRTDAYALISDRFFGARRSKLEGLWIGGGAEYWRSRIRTDSSPAFTKYQNYVATAGSGYVWKVSRHLYLNPWTGGHFVIAGTRDISVGGTVYKQPLFTPEASVKIGISF
jgi:hypothetical protein